ncbi:MAG: hypothetical protein CL678_16265 [Bdellovibrionaceae bacterium]|nr:hypothetical protein [Pseudobdellovibrionaceae bacterium]|tara:strand:- start:1312 stop:1788 length:477 start_codon:yes stop_codon:yes gene_type:complete
MNSTEKKQKTGTVALVVHQKETGVFLQEILSDELEIRTFEKAIEDGISDPLDIVYIRRARVFQEQEDFANYVEELLSQPFIQEDIREHGVQWMKSKIKIDRYEQEEKNAVKTIADYAYQVYLENQAVKEFMLAGPHASVHIKVFDVTDSCEDQTPMAA